MDQMSDAATQSLTAAMLALAEFPGKHRSDGHADDPANRAADQFGVVGHALALQRRPHLLEEQWSRDELATRYGTRGSVGQVQQRHGDHYLDVVTTPASTPGGLARRFIEKYPNIVELGRGSDWSYAGWYVEMLHLTYPNALPIAYANFLLPRGYLTTDVLGEDPKVQVPLPPPGEAPDPV